MSSDNEFTPTDEPVAGGRDVGPATAGDGESAVGDPVTTVDSASVDGNEPAAGPVVTNTEPADLVAADLVLGEADDEVLLEALRDVVDPELGVNIVDLGLVYGINRDPDGHVTIDMTLTSPMCPLTEQLEYEVHYVLSSLVPSVSINWVWLPQWTLDNITDDGREQLRAIGYSL